MHRRKGGVKLTILAVGLLILIAVGLGIWKAAGLMEYSEVNRAADAYRKAGMPWVAAEISTPIPLGSPDNAASSIQKAMAFLGPAPDADEYTGKPSKIAPKDRDAALKLAIEAADKPKANFGRDWDRVEFSGYVQQDTTHFLTRQFIARAAKEMRAGDSAGCVRDLRACWQLGRLGASQGGQLGLDMQVNIEVATLTAIEECLPFLQKNVPALKEIEAFLSEPSSRPDILLAMKREAYKGLALLRNSDNVGGLAKFVDDKYEFEPPSPKVPDAKLVRTGTPSGPDAILYGPAYFRFWTDIKHAADLYGADSSEFADAAASRVRQAKSRAKSNKADAYLGKMVGLLSWSVESGQSVIAGRDTERALVLALEIKAQTGRFPASMGEIPGRWTDPFNGEPLKLVHKNGGIRIYSVGTDRRDDGGEMQSEAKLLGDGDVGACFPPRAYRRQTELSPTALSD